MTHVRQQIREAAADALYGNTDADTYVYSSLVYPQESQDLPLIYCHINSEESDLDGLGGVMARQADLVISAIADGEERLLDNTLDALAAQIESLIGGNLFGGITKQTVLTATEFTRSNEGAKPTAQIALTYAVTYYTDDSDGETAI